MSFERVAVTGGASGLGAAVVRAVRKAGGTPVVLDRQKPADDVAWVEVDLSDPAAAEPALAAAEEAIGDLTGVVTAAGVDACGRLEDLDLADWTKVISVNLIGTAAIAKAAVPRLERSGGRLVTVASTLGLRALSDATAYCASKFGVVGFTRALAVETAGRIGVTMLVPGGMQTSFFDDRPEQYKPGPDAMLNDPDAVADVVIYALSQPRGVEIRELVVCPSVEPSWP
ncbi:SDR family oxidoreductase [Kribbella sp. CA-293567]|uniref:SDR family oxidoreductase n=1 Tax=Kribbella sp. CA-293567 TaxID=3002436 RepID=UPI0022DE8B72|nr:SDR family oxidoreductase [Kribbella sp. CA-293567]WBQ08311.1 SDR family NAD(P)-dependent oxidoreductase [Kribbella sp. CA-293567]